MPDLEITLSVERRRLLAGESLPVKTALVNRGKTPAEVPAAGGQSPFTYLLQAEGEKNPRYVVSEDLTQSMQSRTPAKPPRPQPPELLAPGEDQTREEDLAWLALNPFLPGKYQLTAQYQAGAGMRSNMVEIEIVAPRPMRFAGTVSVMDGTLEGSLANGGPGEAVALLERGSSPGFPPRGVFYRRTELAPGARVTSITSSVNTEEDLAGRWTAWLEDAKLSVVKGWGNRTVAKFEGIDTGLTKPQLIKPGFCLESGSNLFLVAGGKQDRTAVGFYTFRNKEWKKLGEAPLTRGEVPGEMAAQWEEMGSYNAIHVVWLTVVANGAGLEAFTYKSDGTSVDASPRVIKRFAQPPLAWKVIPMAVDDGGSVDVLYREGPAGKLVYERLPIGAGGRAVVKPRQFDPPPKNGEQWAIAPHRLDAVIAANGEQQAWARSTNPGSQWRLIAEHLPQTAFLNVYSLESGSYWVEWLEPAIGFRRSQLPPFPVERAPEHYDDED